MQILQALTNIEQLDEILICTNEYKNVKILKDDDHIKNSNNNKYHDINKNQQNQKTLYESQIKALKNLVNVYEHQILIHLECIYNKTLHSNKDLADGISRSRIFLEP